MQPLLSQKFSSATLMNGMEVAQNSVPGCCPEDASLVKELGHLQAGRCVVWWPDTKSQLQYWWEALKEQIKNRNRSMVATPQRSQSTVPQWHILNPI